MYHPVSVDPFPILWNNPFVHIPRWCRINVPGCLWISQGKSTCPILWKYSRLLKSMFRNFCIHNILSSSCSSSKQSHTVLVHADSWNLSLQFHFFQILSDKLPHIFIPFPVFGIGICWKLSDLLTLPSPSRLHSTFGLAAETLGSWHSCFLLAWSSETLKQGVVILAHISCVVHVHCS